YGQVVAQMEKEGLLTDAIKVLEKMLAVDAEHAATRLKYAELLFASGSHDASRQAFKSLLASLRASGDAAALKKLSDRMSELFPAGAEDDLEAIAARLAAGDLEDGAASLREFLQRDSANLEAWQLLCDA